MSKYKARKTAVDGITFDSQAEARRYQLLKHWRDTGIIMDLELQPAYELAPGVLVPGTKRKRPAVKYVADFRYRVAATGREVIEDVKGVETPMFKLKRHLLALRGVAVEIVR